MMVSRPFQSDETPAHQRVPAFGIGGCTSASAAGLTAVPPAPMTASSLAELLMQSALSAGTAFDLATATSLAATMLPALRFDSPAMGTLPLLSLSQALTNATAAHANPAAAQDESEDNVVASSAPPAPASDPAATLEVSNAAVPTPALSGAQPVTSVTTAMERTAAAVMATAARARPQSATPAASAPAEPPQRPLSPEERANLNYYLWRHCQDMAAKEQELSAKDHELALRLTRIAELERQNMVLQAQNHGLLGTSASSASLPLPTAPAAAVHTNAMPIASLLPPTLLAPSMLVPKAADMFKVLPPPTKYDGDACKSAIDRAQALHDWLDNVDTFFSLTRTPDSVRLEAVKAYMTREAKSWARVWVEKNRATATWECFKAALQARFAPAEMHELLRSELHAMPSDFSLTVAQLAQTVNTYAAYLPEFKDVDSIAWFLSRLPRSMAAALRLDANDKPVTDWNKLQFSAMNRFPGVISATANQDQGVTAPATAAAAAGASRGSILNSGRIQLTSSVTNTSTHTNPRGTKRTREGDFEMKEFTGGPASKGKATRSPKQLRKIREVETALGINLCYYCLTDGHARKVCPAPKPVGQIPESVMSRYDAQRSNTDG